MSKHLWRVACAVLALWVCGVAARAEPAPTPTQAPTLAQVIDRYIAWRGGAAFEALKTIHQSAVLDTPSGRQSSDTWLDRDGRSRIHDDMGGAVFTDAASPEDAWEANASGQILTTEDGFLYSRRQALLEFGDALRSRGGASVTLAGTVTISDQPFADVRITYGDADMYDVFLDAGTGALRGYRIAERGAVSLHDLGDWRRVDGVMMPFSQTLRSDTGRNSATNLASVELNRLFPASLFERPHPPRKSSFAAGANWSGWIDFDFHGGDQIILPVKINGHPTFALLDSGASISGVDRDRALAMGLKPKGAIPLANTDQMVTSAFIEGVNIQAGDMTLSGLTVAALELADLTAINGHELPVILGNEAFNELVVDIDFVHRRVAFRDRAGVTPPPGAVAVPLIRDGLNHLVPVSVEGGPPGQFAVDLGDNGTIDILPAFAHEQHLGEGRRVSQRLAAGLGGIHAEGVTTLRTVEFAGVRLPAVPANLPPERQTGTYSDRIQGALGSLILSRFRLMFDYSGDRLYAAPNPDAVTAPFDKERLGLSMLPEGNNYLVKLVSPGSPAEAAGIKAGDKIIRINGKPAAEWTVDAFYDLRSAAAGSKIELTLEGGVPMTVTLADYY